MSTTDRACEQSAAVSTKPSPTIPIKKSMLLHSVSCRALSSNLLLLSRRQIQQVTQTLIHNFANIPSTPKLELPYSAHRQSTLPPMPPHQHSWPALGARSQRHTHSQTKEEYMPGAHQSCSCNFRPCPSSLTGSSSIRSICSVLIAG